MLVRKRPSTAFHNPLKSGFPSGSRGAGAARFGLPSAVLGIRGSGCFRYWAAEGPTAEMSSTAVTKIRQYMRGLYAGLAVCLAGGILIAQKPLERPFAVAQGRPETILVNGKILAADSKFTIYEALAIRGDRITAAGMSKDIRALADAKTRVIDLGGRTVVPGLTDSHMHAIRAGLSFATEVHWIGAPTIANAIGRLRDASKRLPAGAWVIVAGGWTERQFAEKRRPTQKELVAAVPDNPVYVQLGYQWALMTPKALEALKITRDEDLSGGGKLERDGTGALTGAV